MEIVKIDKVQQIVIYGSKGELLLHKELKDDKTKDIGFK